MEYVELKGLLHLAQVNVSVYELVPAKMLFIDVLHETMSVNVSE